MWYISKLKEKLMDTQTILIIIVVVILLGGGGFFWGRR
jgi:LPXTG-motif cell wall-anchored protein